MQEFETASLHSKAGAHNGTKEQVAGRTLKKKPKWKGKQPPGVTETLFLLQSKPLAG